MTNQSRFCTLLRKANQTRSFLPILLGLIPCKSVAKYAILQDWQAILHVRNESRATSQVPVAASLSFYQINKYPDLAFRR